MPCYRCGVRQTDPSRGQSPWKRGVVQHSQILICPGCQDAADWTADLDRCSRCSGVHLVKRLGEVECRDCGAIVAPDASGETDFAGALGQEPGGAGPGVAGPVPAGPVPAGSGPGSEGGGLEGAGRGPDLSEEVARALDRVLGQSLVSQSIQRAPDPGAKSGSGSRAGAGAAGSRASGSGAAGSGAAGSGAAGSGAAGSGTAGSGAGTARRHRPSRPEAGQHATSHPGTERQRAARPGTAGGEAASLDVVRPGAFAG
jgi:hypothetical protein